MKVLILSILLCLSINVFAGGLNCRKIEINPDKVDSRISKYKRVKFECEVNKEKRIKKEIERNETIVEVIFYVVVAGVVAASASR